MEVLHQMKRSDFSLEEWVAFLKKGVNPLTKESSALPSPTFVRPEDLLPIWTDPWVPDDHHIAHGYDAIHEAADSYLFACWAGSEPIWRSQPTDHRLKREIITAFGTVIICGKSYRMQSPSIILNGYFKDRESAVWDLYVCDANPGGNLVLATIDLVTLQGKDAKHLLKLEDFINEHIDKVVDV